MMREPVSREFTFICEMDIPTTPAAKYHFKSYLTGMVATCGMFGDGRNVALGFEWKTRGALDNQQLIAVTRRIIRAMKGAGMLYRLAYPYFLGQRIDYVASGEAAVTITLRED